jgi:uncharacterized membrane protein YebE (DUF533 family)
VELAPEVVSILAYGILRTELYDIDLKLKIGIRRGTVIGIVIEKLAEQILSREVGWVVGSVLAGLLVFLAPKLNKLGDKVATKAMPQVEPTPAYIQFKKMEVYRAAVESAQETGGIDARHRATLDTLRAKLGLDAKDCALVEAEVVPSAPAA